MVKSGNYLANTLTAPVPQSEKLNDRQVKNSAGGYSYSIDKFGQLLRFLILGSEGGTYYATERSLTTENIGVVKACVAEDGLRTITTIVDVSDKGRAPKNDTCLVALAVCAASNDLTVRRAAFAALPKVARIPTHLFDFLTYLDAIDDLSGRAVRTALSRWYNTKSVEAVAYTVAKYRQRNGWTNGDVMSLAHIAPQDIAIGEDGTVTKSHNRVREEIYRWVTNGGWETIGDHEPEEKALATLWAYEKAKRAKSANEVVPLIEKYNLSREMIPTEFLKDTAIWDALLHAGSGMPIEAMVRNLGVMSAIGLLKPNSSASKYVVSRLAGQENILKSRLHPIKLLAALMTYKQGHGVRGSNVWTPVTAVTDALDSAFYLAFGNVPSTGKDFVYGLDVSGSMGMGEISGIPGLTPRVASAAMLLVSANVEPNNAVIGFTSGSSRSMYGYGSFGMSTGITVLDISAKMRLDDVVRKISSLSFGGTDCALPYIWARENKIAADAFVVYTDNETWAGNIHPSEAIKDYRKKMGKDARGVVVGMTSTEFSIADPLDPGMLDVVGFDTSTPAIISEFVAGNL